MCYGIDNGLNIGDLCYVTIEALCVACHRITPLIDEPARYCGHEMLWEKSADKIEYLAPSSCVCGMILLYTWIPCENEQNYFVLEAIASEQLEIGV